MLARSASKHAKQFWREKTHQAKPVNLKHEEWKFSSDRPVLKARRNPDTTLRNKNARKAMGEKLYQSGTDRGASGKTDRETAKVLLEKYGKRSKSIKAASLQKPSRAEIRVMLGEISADLSEYKATGHDIGVKTLAVVLYPLAKLGLVHSMKQILVDYHSSTTEESQALPANLDLLLFKGIARNRETEFQQFEEYWESLVKRRHNTREAYLVYLNKICGSGFPGRNEKKKQILEDMKQAGMRFDDEIYSILLKSCEGFEEGVRVVEKIKNITAPTFCVLLEVSSRKTGSKGAEQVFELMKSLGKRPAPMHYNILLKHYKDERNHAGVVRTFQALSSSADIISKTILLKYCRDSITAPHDQFDTLAHEVLPGVSFTTPLMLKSIFAVIHAKAGRKDDAIHLYNSTVNSDKKTKRIMDEDLHAAGVVLF
eukprot:TRINITY_DN8645_c0_g1_i1.p1 TRINITY_DN8645_c0_g1~~TRINITY_DN8645_c0_g1_i1.p1  ORF type:complete len:427 (+),score=56.27 TRINITY_DN8645_c0_g1_i1:107-1387(+)